VLAGGLVNTPLRRARALAAHERRDAAGVGPPRRPPASTPAPPLPPV